MSTIARVPEKLTYIAACQFTLDIQELKDEELLVFDFSRLDYSFPLAMLILGASIRNIIRYRFKKELKTQVSGFSQVIPTHTYLEHLGFFDFIYLPNRNKIGNAPGNSRYIPIRRIERVQFETQGMDSKKVQNQIVDYSDDLALVLAGAFEDYEAKRALAYAFKEIIRNVFEHSTANACYIAGQRWADGNVEVAVIDEGRGIRSSLSEAFEVENDEEALKMAIRPGVSRTTGKAINEHDNSGYGLYVLSELGRNFGRFVLGSGDAVLRLRTKNKPKLDQISYRGTFVGLKFVDPPRNFSGTLDDIVAAGEEETELKGERRPASKSSKGF